MAGSRREKYDRKKFIPGVYNYCDRWCEVCRFNDRCLVYHTEQQRTANHLLKGENPEDPGVWMKDVGDSLKQTMKLLTRMATKQGIDLNNLPDEPPRDRKKRRDHPLVERAHKWMERMGALLEKIRTEIPEVGQGIAEGILESEDQAHAEKALEEIKAIRDDYELLSRYRYFILVKLTRAVGGLEEADQESDGFDRDDANGTAKLVNECLGKIIDALWRIAEFHRPWFDDAALLASETEAIRLEIDRAFPDHQSFHRPGFDDEPAP